MGRVQQLKGVVTVERGELLMNTTVYDKVCYRTEQQDEQVALRNTKNGQLGYTFGCTYSGETVQVKLANGELDSWSRDECTESVAESR